MSIRCFGKFQFPTVMSAETAANRDQRKYKCSNNEDGMKRLGHTEYGGVIVEMSHEEWRLLAHLSNVESGLNEWQIMAQGGEQMASLEFDLADTYSKIIAYSQNRAITNELREHVDRMERAFDGGRFKRPKVDKNKTGSKR